MEKVTISKHVFTVTGKETITPHYIRIRLKSTEETAFDQCTLGANNKVFIPPAGNKKVQLATFDTTQAAWVMPDEHMKPIVRTYTHRAIDSQTKEISIDFVNHGDTGPASSWAINAELGDELGVAMKIRPTYLYPAADWYFLIGDSTAIPVISCILESLPASAKGYCLVEIISEDDKHPEVKHPGFQVQWHINPHPEQTSSLAEVAKQVELPTEGSIFSYAACEYSSVKQLRSYFKNQLGWTNKEFYAFSYWKAGLAEDKSVQDRQEERQD